MNDAELIALAALVRAETEGMVAFNEQRAREGYAPSYGDGAFWGNPSTQKLREELERRAAAGGEGREGE